MSEGGSVGDLVAAFLGRCRPGRAFGVISIHNMPMLDALARRGEIDFVPARSEGGAVNMADAYARVSGRLGVAFSSTGTAAGNACGALVEAATAGTPLLHLTGQVEARHLDRGRGCLHEARDQLGMLASVGKGALRAASPEGVPGALREAAERALAPPAGPVSVEIPIDVQAAPAPAPGPEGAAPAPAGAPAGAVDGAAMDRLVEAIRGRRRVMLWLGGGARGHEGAAARLAGLGLGLVTSVQGRGVDAGCPGRTLGSFNLQPAVEGLYRSCDAMVVAGSRLRSNETLDHSLALPRPLCVIDVDASARDRAYRADHFVEGDAGAALEALADGLEGAGFAPDPGFGGDLLRAREEAEAGLRAALGPYEAMLDAVAAAGPRGFVWVRDVTLSNTMWGNRLPMLGGSRMGVHAAGGGIGQGLPMAVGAALAAGDTSAAGRALLLAGDGGFAVTLGELATAVEAGARVTVLLMNDGGYGVIRNIQDARYGGRRRYADILAPDFGRLCGAYGVPHRVVRDLRGFGEALDGAMAVDGPAVVEVDMAGVGGFARPFAGPPARPDGAAAAGGAAGAG